MEPAVTSKGMKKFWDREVELSASWDRYRVAGLRLTHPKWMKTIPWIITSIAYGLLFAPVAVNVLTQVTEPDLGDAVIDLVLLFALLSLPPLATFVMIYGSDVEVSSTGLKSLTFLSKGISSTWNDVQSITYVQRHDYIVKTSSGDISVSPGMQGIGFFLEMVMEQLSEEARREWRVSPSNMEFYSRFGQTYRNRWVDYQDE